MQNQHNQTLTKLINIWFSESYVLAGSVLNTLYSVHLVQLMYWLVQIGEYLKCHWSTLWRQREQGIVIISNSIGQIRMPVACWFAGSCVSNVAINYSSLLLNDWWLWYVSLSSLQLLTFFWFSVNPWSSKVIDVLALWCPWGRWLIYQFIKLYFPFFHPVSSIPSLKLFEWV